MCCRYYMESSPELRPIVEAMNRSPLLAGFPEEIPVRSDGEIRPSEAAPVIASSRAGRRGVFPMKWGFTGKTLLINARTETAAIKPAFRESWKSRRCIVPASWYYEWEHLLSPGGKKKTGDKYMLRQKDSAVTWLCGLYRFEAGLPCFVILTREPGEGIRFIHDRMPLILPEESISDWIRPDADPERLLSGALTELRFERAG